MPETPSIPKPAAAAPVAVAPVAGPAGRIDDFPDWLSPIVVKELRQGLRQPTFVLVFLFLQILLGIVVLFSVLNAPMGSQASIRIGYTVSGFFFVFLSIAILVVQPLRGLGALASEIRTDTLDLLLLTRLDAWRITFGKWLGLVSQSALLVVAVFPYLILRYYLGGMQIFSEMLLLFTLFVTSASLTGVAVGFSSTSSLVIRSIVGVGMLGGLFMMLVSMIGMLFSRAMRSGGGPFSMTFSSAADFEIFAGVILLLAFVGYYFLEMGASQIAPPSENRSTRKRLIGLGVVLGLAVLVPNREILRLWFCGLASNILIMDALTERPEITASVLRPFRRFGSFRRLLGAFLLPGWPFGMVFAAMLGGLILAGIAAKQLTEPSVLMESANFTILSLASLSFPAVVVALFFPRVRHPFGIYLIVLMASVIVSLVFFILGQVSDMESGIGFVFVFIPPIGLMAFAERGFREHETTIFIMALIVLGIHGFLLAVRAAKHWQAVAAMDRAAQLDSKPGPDAS